MLVHTHRSRPLFVIYHAFLLCLVASILPRGTRHHQVDGQAVGGRPPTGRDNRLFLRDLISYVPISPLQVPVGYPQKLIAVVEELDEENGDLVRTHLCYMAFNGPEDLSNQMSSCVLYNYPDKSKYQTIENGRFIERPGSKHLTRIFDRVERYRKQVAGIEVEGEENEEEEEEEEGEERAHSLELWIRNFQSMAKYNLSFRRPRMNKGKFSMNSVVVSPNTVRCVPSSTGRLVECEFTALNDDVVVDDVDVDADAEGGINRESRGSGKEIKWK